MSRQRLCLLPETKKNINRATDVRPKPHTRWSAKPLVWSKLGNYDLQVLPASPSWLIHKPGRVERYNIARNYLRYYNNVGMTASYEVAETLLSEYALETLTFMALRRIIDRHPVMSISIADEGSINPFWVRLPEIDLKEVVRFHNLEERATESRVIDIVQAAHQIPFENLEKLPLWRLVVIQHPSSHEQATKTIDIGFFWHHGIGDGVCGVAFHLEFLDALNNVRIENDAWRLDTIVHPPKLDLLPPIEEAHPLPLSTFFIVSQILKAIIPNAIDKLLWTGPPVRPKNNIARLRTLFFPSLIVDALLSQCRANDVTLTPLLIVVIARVLATIYPDYERFKCKTPISLRGFARAGNRTMVNYTTSIGHTFSSKPKGGFIHCGGVFSWSAVQACKREINARTSGPKNHSIGLLKFLNDYVGFLRNRAGRERAESFEVSNIGVMDGKCDSVKIRRILFSQSSNVVGPAYVFSVATAKGGDLGITLTWQDEIVDLGLVERVLAGLDSELRGLARRNVRG